MTVYILCSTLAWSLITNRLAPRLGLGDPCSKALLYTFVFHSVGSLVFFHLSILSGPEIKPNDGENRRLGQQVSFCVSVRCWWNSYHCTTKISCCGHRIWPTVACCNCLNKVIVKFLFCLFWSVNFLYLSGNHGYPL